MGDLKSMKDRPKLYRDYEQRRGEIETHVTRGNAQLEALIPARTLLGTKQHEILGVWAGDTKVTTTLPGLESKIAELKAASESLTPGTAERRVASMVFDLCHSMVSKDVSDALASARSAASDWEQVKGEVTAPARDTAATSPPPPSGRLTEWEHHVGAVGAVVDVVKRHRIELGDLKKRVDKRCRAIERKPAWLYFLKDLVGWTSAE